MFFECVGWRRANKRSGGNNPDTPYILAFLKFLAFFVSVSHLFSRAILKGHPFLACLAAPSTPPSTEPSPCRFQFLYKEGVILRSHKEGVLGKKIAWRGVGWSGNKKRKKDVQKKVGVFLVSFGAVLPFYQGFGSEKNLCFLRGFLAFGQKETSKGGSINQNTSKVRMLPLTNRCGTIKQLVPQAVLRNPAEYVGITGTTGVGMAVADCQCGLSKHLKDQEQQLGGVCMNTGKHCPQQNQVNFSTEPTRISTLDHHGCQNRSSTHSDNCKNIGQLKDGVSKTKGNDICVATGMTVRCCSEPKHRQCTGKRLSRAMWSSFNEEGMSHVCDSTVASPATRRGNVLASKCE